MKNSATESTIKNCRKNIYSYDLIKLTTKHLDILTLNYLRTCTLVANVNVMD